MATISYDGQSFLIDGRRIWLVSGAIHYARTPHQLWRQRIRAAKQAGLNCVETYVFWNVHEPRPGVFNFEGDANLRRFIEIIAEEGLYCILRPGPYICSEWDFGGFPPWLQRIPDIKLRQANGPYLEACARYLGAVLAQVKDLQINETGVRSPSAGNGTQGVAAGPPSAVGKSPIIMIQAENEWMCHNPAQGDGYLREIVRYLRESGCTVPINFCNNLWQRVDGVIDTWNANQHLAFDLRQLHLVQPNAPRLVSEFWPGWFDRWGSEHHRDYDASWLSYRLAQILGTGAQYNLYMFHGGTNFGFYGGRSNSTADAFLTTSYDFDAPLMEAGGRGAKYAVLKRISTFASHFGQLFANLDPGTAPAVIAPIDSSDHPLCVLHQTGAQGEVVFILKSKRDKITDTRIMLPNGLNLPVPLGDDRVAWFVLRANLGGVAELTYTNLRPWALVGRKLLALFGPARADGLVAINGAPLNVKVPTGRSPLVVPHEGFTLVILNGEQVDAAYITPTGLAVGAAGLDESSRPIPLAGWGAMTLINVDGQTRRNAAKPAKPATAPRLGAWTQASVADVVNGTATAFQPIPGPASFADLNCDFGYGWYRLRFPRGAPAFAANALAPLAGDRLHFFSDGKPTTLLGLGPGADFDPTPVKLGRTTVVLADNLGRFNFGWALGEHKGLFGHLYAVKPIKLAQPQVVAEKAPDPFTLSGLVLYQRVGERLPADTLVWKIKAAKSHLILDIQRLPARAMVLVNGQPIGLYDHSLTAGIGRFLLRHGNEIRTGKNEIRLALFQKLDGSVNPLDFVHLYEATDNLTSAAEWSFTCWRPPAQNDFGPVSRANAGRPAWYRCTFKTPATPLPLWLQPTGMSKGQIYLNGHNVGRYFVATAGGKPVPPQERYYLPEPWLKTDGANELVLFDEHGKSPAKCRLVYDANGPYGK